MRLVIRLTTVLTCTGLALLSIAPRVFAGDPAGATSATASVTGGSFGDSLVVRTPAEQAFVDVRTQLVLDYARVRAGTLDRATFDVENDAFLAQYPQFSKGRMTALDIQALATTSTLGVTEAAQQTTYYCGAATAYEILGYLGASGPGGESLTQSHLAYRCVDGYLCTDHLRETPWYYYSGYPHPMVSTLNAWMNGPMWYAAFSGSASYVSWLVYDIDYLHPLALSVNELANPSTPHLVGHPTNIAIGHWVAARGYASSGAQTNYADSVHGTTFWTWSKNVPAYSTIYSDQRGMSYLMDVVPHGYVG